MHSGIAFWGRIAPEQGDPYTYAGHLVMFPSGWGMYDLYGRNGLPVDGGPAKKVGKQHDWNDLEILAQGNRVRVAVNGDAGRRLARPRARPDQGGADRPAAPLQQGPPGGPVQGPDARDVPEGRPADHGQVNQLAISARRESTGDPAGLERTHGTSIIALRTFDSGLISVGTPREPHRAGRGG